MNIIYNNTMTFFGLDLESKSIPGGKREGGSRGIYNLSRGLCGLFKFAVSFYSVLAEVKKTIFTSKHYMTWPRNEV